MTHPRRSTLMGIVFVLVAALAGPAGATHFDGSSSTGSFNPQFAVSVSNPIENRPADLTLSFTQADHEDPPRIMYFRTAAGWQLRFADARPAQKADGTAAVSCTDALSAAGPNGLRDVVRGEIVGSLRLVATSDVTAPRTQPLVWEGPLYPMSWDALTNTAQVCFHISSSDSRLQTIYESGQGDLRQITSGGPVLYDSVTDRWQIDADLTDLVADSTLQAAQASALELTVTTYGNSQGNWQLADPLDPAAGTAPIIGFTKNKAIDFTGAPWKQDVQFEAEFHSCHQHTGEPANPCGSLAATTQPDVVRTPAITLYPAHARPVVAAPEQNAVRLGTNQVSLQFGPHAFSAPASDATKGLKGYLLTVVPIANKADADVLAVHASSGACPASALVCRGATDPILVGTTATNVTVDAAGNATVNLTTGADGWYVYRITTLYNDGHSSLDQDLAFHPSGGLVAGSTEGQVYTGLDEWPFAYLGTYGGTPVLFFVDPDAKAFKLVSIFWTAEGVEPTMSYAQTGDTGEGTGAFNHVSGTPLTGQLVPWTLAAEFGTDGATGLFQAGLVFFMPFQAERV